jgi:hypothetical protein
VGEAAAARARGALCAITNSVADVGMNGGDAAGARSSPTRQRLVHRPKHVGTDVRIFPGVAQAERAGLATDVTQAISKPGSVPLPETN